eukprot:CAMPEP_0175145572 /NCGR_PEP_ID=MMETSP0087-20121206/14853_1 /TAXON_ID=136419 /ORGANISM="Unknown Unknown, Strain D1" /LENGTH=383 /DNA_ID=CAMNT_0016430349 /DNA_START=17 /DNA_END=1168 /DNA_ORIENTATION=+
MSKEEKESKKREPNPEAWRYKKIDMHTHILPEHIPDFAKRFGYGDFIQLKYENTCSCNAKMYKGDRFFREVEPNCFKPEPRMEDCDDTGVTVQVLSTVPVMFSYWTRPADGLVVSQELNDHISSICKKYPKRFVGLGTVPMQSPELAVKELERCMTELGMVGIQIGSHINDKALSDPDLFPVFEACERLGAVVFVHPWDMIGSKLMEKYWLPWLVSMPAETSFAICSMIFGGVFERLPKLKVCFAHGGGSFPQTIGRVEHGFRCRPDLCAQDNNVNPRDYLGKFWVDSLVHDGPTLEFMVKLMGHENIVLGSDYPFPLGEIATEITPEQRPGRLVEQTESLTEQQKKDILWYNGLKFLGLKEEDFLPDDDGGARSTKKARTEE